MDKVKSINGYEVNQINKKLEQEISELKEQIENLENKIYKYSVGEHVIYKDLRVVKIIDRIKSKDDYLYEGYFQIGEEVRLKAEDILGRYHSYDYQEILQNALIDLQRGEEFKYIVNDFNTYKPKYKKNFDLR